MQAGRTTAGHGQESLQLVLDALRLSAHVVRRDPTQLPEQLVGRLLSSDEPGVRRLLQQVRKGKRVPWLRPLFATIPQAGGPLLRVLDGHTHQINAVAVTPDGRYAVSRSVDKTLKVWDLERGKVLRTFKVHADSVAVVPDGRHAVSASREQTLTVWDLADGTLVATFIGEAESCACAVSPLGGDDRGDSAHRRRLALVSAQAGITRINWRSLALAGASPCPFNPQVFSDIPWRPAVPRSGPRQGCLSLGRSSPLVTL